MSSTKRTERTNRMGKNKAWRNTFKRFSQSWNLRSKLRAALSFLFIYALVIVPLTTFSSVMPQAQAKKNSPTPSGSPDHIFQNCPFGCNGVEDALENLAIDDVLEAYRLPATDRTRVLHEGRNEVRAMLYLRVLELIKKQSPTATEQQALAALAARIRQKRVDAANAALEEYQRWKNDPCHYYPPSPLTYDPGLACHSPLAALFNGPVSPSFEEFVQFGALRTYAGLNSSDAQFVAAQTAKGIVVGSGLAAIGIGTAVGTAIGGAVPALVTAILPFAELPIGYSTAAAASAAGASASGAVSGASLIGGAAGIVLVALTIAISQTINIVNASQVEGKLNTAITEAQNATINLQQEIANPDGLKLLYGQFILMTLPEALPVIAPAPAPTDRQFIIREEGAATTTDSATLTYLNVDSNNLALPYDARLSGAWFATKLSGLGIIEDSKLSIQYIDWDGKKMTAARAGTQFILTQAEDSSTTKVVDEIQYLDPNDNKHKSARIKFEQMTVTGDPLVRVRCPSFLNQDVNVIVGSVAASGDPANALVVTVNNGPSATVNGITVRNLAVNSQYQITAQVDAAQVSAPTRADFVVKVTNTIGQTQSATFTIRRTEAEYNLPGAMPALVNIGSPIVVQLDGDNINLCSISSGYTITDGSLPNGVSIQQNTIEAQPCGGGSTGFGAICIAGAPTSGGSYTFTLNRSYSNGERESRTYNIIVNSEFAELPNGMVSWWRGERNTEDFTNRSPGTLFGSASFGEARVNRGFKFDGTNGYVKLPVGTFEPQRNFSYELWFKTSTRGVILGQQFGVTPYNTPQASKPPLYVGTDGKLRVDFFTSTNTNGTPATVSPNRVDDNYYHHVAVVYDDTAHTEQVYLDGVLINTVASYVQFPNTNYFYQLGTGYVNDSAAAMNGWYNFNGLVDEPTLYHSLLTASEISAIFKAGAAGKISVVTQPLQPSTRNGTDGAIAVFVKGGLAPILYSKDNGATFQEGNTFYDLSPGDYNIVIKDAANRTYSRTVKIWNPFPEITIHPVTNDPICAGARTGSVNLLVEGANGTVLYSITNGEQVQTTSYFPALPAGTYTPWVKDESGAVAVGEPFQLVDPPQLVVNPSVLPNIIVGQPFSRSFTSSGGPSGPPRTMTVSGVPPGLTATTDASRITISGTPQQTGNFTLSFSLAVAHYCLTVRDVSLVIVDPSSARATTTTVGFIFPSPSAIGQATIINYNVAANVSGAGTPTGDVTVTDGTNSCTGTVAAGNCSITFNTLGPHNLTATYSGNANFDSDTSPSVIHMVNNSMSVSDVSVAEGNVNGTVKATVTVKLGAPAGSGGVTFDAKTVNGIAQAGVDYTAINFPGLTIAPGETSKTVEIPITSNTIRGANKTFGVFLSNPTNASVLDALNTITIVNDDPALGDFGLDGKTDATIWNPVNGNWFVRSSSTGALVKAANDWGRAALGDIAVPGDYNGDGQTDIAVFRPSEGNWYVLKSAPGNGTVPSLQNWGQTGDIPVPADYDGDGRTDYAVYRPSEGNWYILRSNNGTPVATINNWGTATDKPVRGDFEGDGKTDIAVFRPTEGTWYILQSTGGASVQNWGLSSDRPVPGDYDGDGKTDIAVYRTVGPNAGSWYIRNSSGGTLVKSWGNATDLPVPGNYDGDNKTDIAVWRPSDGNWYAINSTTNTVNLQNNGASGQVPAPSTYLPQ